LLGTFLIQIALLKQDYFPWYFLKSSNSLTSTYQDEQLYFSTNSSDPNDWPKKKLFILLFSFLFEFDSSLTCLLNQTWVLLGKIAQNIPILNCITNARLPWYFLNSTWPPMFLAHSNM
jgi:hypothetical protein